MTELIAEENKMMMMDPTTMAAYTRVVGVGKGWKFWNE
jgi:hypothetical protein